MDDTALRDECKMVWLGLHAQSSVETHQIKILITFAKRQRAAGLREAAGHYTCVGDDDFITRGFQAMCEARAKAWEEGT